MADDPISSGDEALQVKAEAVGEPGQRRFRLLAIIDRETRIVWLEKEQLARLAQALEQVLDNLPGRGPESSTPALVAKEFDIDTRHQIRAGRMELGFDENRKHLIIIAHDLEADDASAPAFVCRLTPGQARELAEEAAEVVMAGRPLCPLCGRPIDPGGHSCDKQNGHFPHRLDEVREDGDDA